MKFEDWYEENKQYIISELNPIEALCSPIEALRFAFTSGYVEGSKMERDKQSRYHAEAYERRKRELSRE